MRRFIAVLISVSMFMSVLSGCKGKTDTTDTKGTEAVSKVDTGVKKNEGAGTTEATKPAEAVQTVETATLSPENTSATLGDGITVDVGDFVLDGEENLTVEKQEVEENQDEGYKIEAYDFSIGDMKELDDFITIRIPYDTSFCEAGQDPARCVGAKYKNEETGEWEDVLFEVDEDAKELVIYTDHLSVYGAFYVENEGRRNAYIADVLGYYSYMDKSQTIDFAKRIAGDDPSVMREIMRQGAEATGLFFDYADQLDNAINIVCSDDIPNWLDTSIPETNQTLFSALGYINTCTNLLKISLKDTVGGGADKREVLNLIRDVGSKVTTYWANALTKVGTGALSISMGGVLVLDKMLTAFAEEAQATKLEDIAYVYHHYNEGYYGKNHKPMTPKDWRAKVIQVLERHPDDPEIAMAALEAGFNEYASQFFKLSGDDMYDVAADTPNVTVRRIPNFTEAEKQQLMDEYIVHLKNTTMPAVLTSVRNYMIKKMEQQQLEAVEKVREYYNTKITINMTEEIKEGEGSQYKGYKLRMAPLSNKAIEKDWAGIWPEGGKLRSSATLLGFTIAGYPHTLEFFKPDADMNTDQPELTVPFVISMPEINITFGGKEALSVESFMGEWINQDGERMILILNGGNVIEKDPDLSWYAGDVCVTEYSAEVDDQTLVFKGITTWVTGPENLYTTDEAHRLELDASSLSDELTALAVQDGMVTEMTNGTNHYTRN